MVLLLNPENEFARARLAELKVERPKEQRTEETNEIPQHSRPTGRKRKTRVIWLTEIPRDAMLGGIGLMAGFLIMAFLLRYSENVATQNVEPRRGRPSSILPGRYPTCLVSAPMRSSCVLVQHRRSRVGREWIGKDLWKPAEPSSGRRPPRGECGRAVLAHVCRLWYSGQRRFGWRAGQRLVRTALRPVAAAR